MVKAIIENFKEIVTKKYVCFSGRASRKEFWYFVLATAAVSAILGCIPKIGVILSIVWSLGLLLPSLGVTARRLQDQGKSAWMILTVLIPVIGVLVLLLLCVPEGTKEANAYGEPVE